MIVAFGRELGAGGRAVGERVARILGVELLDKQIVDLVAARLGAPTAYVEARDEQVEGFVERLFRVITSAYPEAYVGDNVPDWPEERLAHLTAQIIQEQAQTQSLVVIGRGAPILLRNRPDVCRVLVVASMETRARRLSERLAFSYEDAMRQLRQSDQHRTAYMHQHYQVDWRNAHLYDVVVNTDRLDYDAAAQVVVEASRRLGLAQAPA